MMRRDKFNYSDTEKARSYVLLAFLRQTLEIYFQRQKWHAHLNKSLTYGKR